MVMDSDADTHARYAYNGKVMLGSAILLFLIILIIIYFHTYRYSCFSLRHHHRRRRRRRRHHNPHLRHVPDNKGLHPSVINFLPTFTNSSATSPPLHDCAVCLSKFADDGEFRILPNCNHAFHSHCIDAWFHSHSNCPLCRAPVHQPAAPVQPPHVTPPTESSDVEFEPYPVSGRGAGQMTVGSSSFPAPIGSPRKPLELVGIIVELQEAERLRESVLGHVPGDSGSKGADNRIPSFKRSCSV